MPPYRTFSKCKHLARTGSKGYCDTCRSRNDVLKKREGISRETWDKQMSLQNNLCACCNLPMLIKMRWDKLHHAILCQHCASIIALIRAYHIPPYDINIYLENDYNGRG